MKAQIKVLMILALALIAVLVYAIVPKSDALKEQIVPLNLEALRTAPTTDAEVEAIEKADSIERVKTREVDTTAQRILFFGDSMLETLARHAADYAAGNGHEIHSIVWYSSNSKIWAETDTLQHFIRKYDPTFIMVCLCSNELFVRDLDNRERYIRKIVEKIGKIPFIWISPPNWKDDTGINERIIKAVGKERYFDSCHYRERMARRRDHAHPTQEAANWWMDSIALWMNSMETAHPILMQPTDTVVKVKNMILLQPVEQ